MKCGLILGNFSCFHNGYMELIKLASKECDAVKIFASNKDRQKSPAEAKVYFEDKKRIFDEYIIPFLPCNVEVEWHDNPVKYFYFFAGTANENNSQFEFCVYGDDFDISKNFPEPTREKYFGDLYRSGRLKFKGIPRYLTSPISATQMRYFIANNMRNEFLYNLPEEIRHIDIWNILRRRWEEENLCAEEDFVVDYLLKGFNVE